MSISKRFKFQRGRSPHAHNFAWLDNAPNNTLEKDDNKILVSSSEAFG